MGYEPRENEYNANNVGAPAPNSGLYKAARVGLVAVALAATVASSGCLTTSMRYRKAENQLGNVKQMLTKEPETAKEAKLQERLRKKYDEVDLHIIYTEAFKNVPKEQKEAFRQKKQSIVVLEDFVEDLKNKQGR